MAGPSNARLHVTALDQVIATHKQHHHLLAQRRADDATDQVVVFRGLEEE